MRVRATIDQINPERVAIQHSVDPAILTALEQHYESVEGWPYQPVLVLEDEGNGHTILDGHHRVQLAREYGVTSIPAWIVSISDYCRVLAAHFDGSTPHRLSDLDPYILCNGKAYSR
jgi:hypothetical protein